MEENEKQIKINVPTGYVIDREHNTFECIKFKKKEKRFADYDGSYNIEGFYIRSSEFYAFNPNVDCGDNCQWNKDVFDTLGAAKSALAFAQITQIREHEFARYGYKPLSSDNGVYVIEYDTEHIVRVFSRHTPCTRLESYLAFSLKEQAELFLKENIQLIKEYFMMD